MVEPNALFSGPVVFRKYKKLIDILIGKIQQVIAENKRFDSQKIFGEIALFRFF